MDLSISFLQPLRLGGDNPTPPCGGETLFWLGEAILMPVVVGDTVGLRIAGVSSSTTVLTLFSNLGEGRTISHFRSMWEPYNAGERPMESLVLVVLLAIEENGSSTDNLKKENKFSLAICVENKIEV